MEEEGLGAGVGLGVEGFWASRSWGGVRSVEKGGVVFVVWNVGSRL